MKPFLNCPGIQEMEHVVNKPIPAENSSPSAKMLERAQKTAESLLHRELWLGGTLIHAWLPALHSHRMGGYWCMCVCRRLSESERDKNMEVGAGWSLNNVFVFKQQFSHSGVMRRAQIRHPRLTAWQFPDSQQVTGDRRILIIRSVPSSDPSIIYDLLFFSGPVLRGRIREHR